jgi:hypothetical protein
MPAAGAASAADLDRATQAYISPLVNWITFAGMIPRHGHRYRMARANFNIRGWQGR